MSSWIRYLQQWGGWMLLRIVRGPMMLAAPEALSALQDAADAQIARRMSDHARRAPNRCRICAEPSPNVHWIPINPDSFFRRDKSCCFASIATTRSSIRLLHSQFLQVHCSAPMPVIVPAVQSRRSQLQCNCRAYDVQPSKMRAEHLY